MAASLDAELKAVPRANDTQVPLIEREAGGGALFIQNLAHRRDNQALANGPGLMRAGILIRIQPALEAKYPDGFLAGIHHKPASFGNLGARAGGKFSDGIRAIHLAARQRHALQHSSAERA